jgi:type IV secretory pathway VirB10-like protein
MEEDTVTPKYVRERPAKQQESESSKFIAGYSMRDIGIALIIAIVVILVIYLLYQYFINVVAKPGEKCPTCNQIVPKKEPIEKPAEEAPAKQAKAVKPVKPVTEKEPVAAPSQPPEEAPKPATEVKTPATLVSTDKSLEEVDNLMS